jgi:hypothetical protein
MQSNAILDAISVLIGCIYNLEINLRDIAENFNFDKSLANGGKINRVELMAKMVREKTNSMQKRVI